MESTTLILLKRTYCHKASCGFVACFNYNLNNKNFAFEKHTTESLLIKKAPFTCKWRLVTEYI
ncbi:protein of unknown function [Chryseobacterium sp. JV274]|nr:protein of unknown function [Chryseobacterium sp. JV274]